MTSPEERPNDQPNRRPILKCMYGTDWKRCVSTDVTRIKAQQTMADPKSLQTNEGHHGNTPVFDYL